jgi:aminopeptidase N
MKRYLSALVFILLFCFLLPLFSLAQNYKKVVAFPEFTIPPSEGHKILGQAKAKYVEKLRKLIPSEMLIGHYAYDVTYYKLDLLINDTTEIVYGEVEMVATCTTSNMDSVTINLYDDMDVDSIKSQGTLLSYNRDTHSLHIELDKAYGSGEELTVVIFYHGHPTESGLMGFNFSTQGGFPVISTLSEPYSAHTWWPCKDTPSDKADSADINVTIRPDLIVASNGLLREVVTNPDGTKTYKWHESYPITTYLISLAITNYLTFSQYYYPEGDSVDSMEIIYYCYPDWLEAAQAVYPVTVKAVEFYSRTFGEYPFVKEKYGMAHFPWGGAMEHQTCTSMLFSWYDDYVIVHELAHQWWGDLITCRDWHNIWLNEGFASYCEALWFEDTLGEDYYHNYMAGMDYSRGGTIYVYDTTNVGNIFSLIVYDKGAWVLHMLRHMVGDSTFFDILRAYYSDPRFAYKDAVTEEFQDLCQTVSGMDLNYFFQQWIYGEYRPDYRYSWMVQPVPLGSIKQKAKLERISSRGLPTVAYNLYLHIRQVQTTDPTFFTMPIDVKISTISGKDTTFVVLNDPHTLDFKFTLSSNPTEVEIDPENWILKYASSESYGFNIVTTSLPAGSTFYAYQETLESKGGNPPYLWTIIDGELPGGMILDSLSGVIHRAPLDSGDFTFTVQAQDAESETDIQVLTLYVAHDTTAPCDIVYDGVLNLVDIMYLIDYIFKSGPEPPLLKCADVNCENEVTVSDVVYLINYVLKNGPPPCYME